MSHSDINTDRSCELCGADWRGALPCPTCGYDGTDDDPTPALVNDGPREFDWRAECRSVNEEQAGSGR